MKQPGVLLSLAILMLVIERVVAYTLDINNIYKGEYRYSYDTDAISESRESKVDENGDLVVKGSYTFFVEDTEYMVTYYADKNGYHPTVTMSKIPSVIESVPFGLPARAVASILG